MIKTQFLIDVKLKKEKIESFEKYPFHLNTDFHSQLSDRTLQTYI